MKLPLATGILSATIMACSGGGTTTAPTGTSNTNTNTNTTASKLMMRVDRTLENKSAVKTQDDLAAESYQVTAPVDRWEVSIEGSKVTLNPVTPSAAAQGPVEGVEVSPPTIPGERRFDLQKGVFAGGRFVVRGDEGEVTIYGSGVPIVSSERGKLIKH